MPGAFSHEACLTFLPDHEAVAYEMFEDVPTAVADGWALRGVLPVANNYAGEVPGISDLIERSGLLVSREVRLPVRLHLLAMPGTSLDQITAVVSHPMALKQCTGTLSRLGLRGEEAINTAVAAATLRDPDQAVLASAAAAEAYGLLLLLCDVHDHADNATTFAVLEKLSPDTSCANTGSCF